MSDQQQPKSAAPYPPVPVPQEAVPTQPSLFPIPPPRPRITSDPAAPRFPDLQTSHRASDSDLNRIPYWLQQSERFLRVIVRIYIGLVVCLVPWYPPFWDANPLFTQWPWLTALITHGACRGLVSGLGLLNLWVALQDMIRLPEHPRPR